MHTASVAFHIGWTVLGIAAAVLFLDAFRLRSALRRRRPRDR